jgi:hypothetical protein
LSGAIRAQQEGFAETAGLNRLRGPELAGALSSVKKLGEKGTSLISAPTDRELLRYCPHVALPIRLGPMYSVMALYFSE